MTEPVTIGFGEVKWLKDSVTKMVTLSRPSSSSGTVSMHDDTATDYQVPTGKKFIIIRVDHGDSYSGAECFAYLYKSTTADSATGTLIKQDSDWNDSNARSTKNAIPTYIEVEAGNYINSYNNQGVNYCNVLGVETDV